MPSHEDVSDPLMFLANVALGFDWGPEQQSTLPPFPPDSPVSPVSPYSPEAGTIVSASPAERSTDSASREGDAVGSYSSRGEEEQRRSTQSVSSVTATNSSRTYSSSSQHRAKALRP